MTASGPEATRQQACMQRPIGPIIAVKRTLTPPLRSTPSPGCQASTSDHHRRLSVSSRSLSGGSPKVCQQIIIMLTQSTSSYRCLPRASRLSGLASRLSSSSRRVDLGHAGLALAKKKPVPLVRSLQVTSAACHIHSTAEAGRQARDER